MRYAIARQTYSSSQVAKIVIDNVAIWSPATRQTLINDIQSSFDHNSVDPLSTDVWQTALKELKKQTGL